MRTSTQPPAGTISIFFLQSSSWQLGGVSLLQAKMAQWGSDGIENANLGSYDTKARTAFSHCSSLFHLLEWGKKTSKQMLNLRLPENPLAGLIDICTKLTIRKCMALAKLDVCTYLPIGQVNSGIVSFQSKPWWWDEPSLMCGYIGDLVSWQRSI